MEAALERESRLSRGWRLTVAAYGLMRQDPTMIALALIGTSCALAATGLMLYLGGVFSGHYSRTHFWLVSLAFVYPLTFLGAFFNVALAAAAAACLEGRWIGISEALRMAIERLRQILIWSLMLVGIGFLLNEIAARIPYLGGLAARLLGAAWNLGTIFAVPLLTLEEAEPLEALQGSARLVKSKWGEGLTGMIGIAAWSVLALIPVGLVAVIGVVIVRHDPIPGATVICLAAAGFVGIVAMATATRQVFAVALYRYATGAATPGFELRDLENPFTAKEKKSGRRTRTWAWIALALIVGFVALAAIFGHGRPAGPEGPGFWYATYNSQAETLIRDGMPVIYEGRRIGTVVEHQSEGGGIRVGYYVDPGLHLPVGKAEPALMPGPKGPYMRLIPPAGRPPKAGSTERS